MIAINHHLILRSSDLTNWWSLIDRYTGRRIVYAGHDEAALCLHTTMNQRMDAGMTFDEAYFNALREAS